MLQRESNADETLGKHRKNINTNEEGVLLLQVATGFMQYIPVDVLSIGLKC
jgi:hypothetical protein